MNSRVFQRKEKGFEAGRAELRAPGVLQDLGPGKKRPLECWLKFAFAQVGEGSFAGIPNLA